MNKPSPNTFAEKISPEQHQQLIDWLTDHSYAEVRELIAAPAQEGFGIDVSISTLSRFYKNHYNQITSTRRQKFDDRLSHIYEMTEYPADYRTSLTDLATFCLQERLCELLSQPIKSVDDLKKLTHICKQIRESKLDRIPNSDLGGDADAGTENLKQALALLQRTRAQNAL